MAEYFVAEVADGGNDSNNGTAVGTPKLTVGAALNLTSEGDTVWIRRGIYTDTWPVTKILGRIIRAYEGGGAAEDVTIDCEGLRTEVSTGSLNLGAISGEIGLTLLNLKFVNYTLVAFRFTGTYANSPNPTVDHIKNCFFKPNTGGTTYGIADIHQSQNAGIVENCTLVEHTEGAFATRAFASWTPAIFRNNIIVDNGYVILDGTGGGEIIGSTSGGTELNYNAYPGAASHGGFDTDSVDSDGVTPLFNNAGVGDYSLDPVCTLRRAGKNGANIGASFNPTCYVDGVWAENALSAGVNDEDYYDTGLPGPGPDGPVDAGPVIFTSGIWKLDNVSEPGAKSGRVMFGPFSLPAGAKLTIANWFGVEDESLSSGSKTIFGHLINKRDIEISINGGAKTAYDKNDFINANASTVTFFVTIRADGTTVS